jgi:haloacid dehalogenase superfamily, subfamily IA, variant 3 with third motif having DD or ED/haloacid dehalogenase superfamily, subfamily IA, variant 1 with third motif having Dx(3-4)D or Dx(3-4)E
MKRAIDLIMFDLDGTLADTGRDLADAVNHTRAHFDLPALADSLVYANVGRGVEHLLRQSLPRESSEHFQKVMQVFLARYENHLLDATALYPDVRKTLDYFRDKKRVVVSNKVHRLTVAVLRGLGVETEFDAILGGDSALEKKPHPALLNDVLRRFDVPRDRAIIVGDGDTDMEAGKRAGIITCGVTYGLGDRDKLLAAQPDFIIDNLRELLNYFY